MGAYGETLGGTWGGIAFDNEPDPIHLVAYVTEDLDHHRAAIRAIVRNPDRVDVHLVRYSQRDLARQRDEILQWIGAREL